jgi:hypothetical protein
MARRQNLIEPEILLRMVDTELRRHAFQFQSEATFQRGIGEVLLKMGLAYEREYIASKADRFDFWLPLERGGIAVEAKVDGSLPDALAQVARYCALPCVEAVMIVSSKRWNYRVPSNAAIGSKPVRVTTVSRRAF